MESNTFKIIQKNAHALHSDCIFPCVKMSISSEASLRDVLYAFEKFLEASGYVLPQNSTLDFVEE